MDKEEKVDKEEMEEREERRDNILSYSLLLLSSEVDKCSFLTIGQKFEIVENEENLNFVISLSKKFQI